ncbi:MAG TPA: zf-HC2 domain-containing protein [Actinomycetota bacterium]
MNTHDQPELLSAFVDGELDAAANATVAEHAATCAACAAVVDALRATAGDLALLEDLEWSDLDAARVRGALRTAGMRRPRRFGSAMTALGGAAAVLVAIFAFAGGFGGRSASTGGVSDTAGQPLAVPESAEQNYNEKTAAALIDGRTRSAAEVGVAASGDSAFTSGPGAPSDDATAEDCRTEIGKPEATERTILARFKGTPAYFFVYTEDDHRELWVVSRTDCTVLYFAQADR